MGMAKRTLTRERRDPDQFLAALSAAFWEWVLMFLLFTDAALSYLLIKFACYCKSPAPCLLCSRAFFGKEKPGLCKELTCNAHKLEISALVCCRVHHKLANAHEMCNGCLGLFMDREDIDFGECMTKARSLKCCACCSVPFRNRSLASRLIHSKKPIGGDVCESGFSSCGSQLRDGLAKAITDSESGVPFSDGNSKFKEQFVCVSPEEAFRTVAPGNPDPVIPMPQASILATERELQLDDPHPGDGIDSGVEEIYLDRSEARSNPPTSSGMIPEPVPAGAPNTNLDTADFGDADHGVATKHIILETNQLTNERPSTGIKDSPRSPVTTEFISGRPSSMVNGQGDESRLSDASTSVGVLKHVKGYSIDRYDSGVESSDGSLISEIEGESEVEQLKRRIEMDTKSISVLYKELEEERNASTIAANQAMAMINRLQEEKAAMQMDAFQYQRMMEEQSEYDQEALQKLNDLLADRDKEIQDLEFEIGTYRMQYGDEPLTGEVLESLSDFEEREFTPVTTPRFMRSGDSETGLTLVKNTVLDFEDEKVYILACLRRLEKRLQLFSNNAVYVGRFRVSALDDKEGNIPDKSSLLEYNATRSDEYLVKAVDNNGQACPQIDNVTLENSPSGVTVSGDSSPSLEDLHIKASSSPSSFRGVQFSITEALKKSRLRSLSFNEREFEMSHRRHDIIALGNEISKLNSRLEVLESDRSFLEHAVKSLRNESTGLPFIQEIACHLRELRKIGTTC